MRWTESQLASFQNKRNAKKSTKTTHSPIQSQESDTAFFSSEEISFTVPIAPVTKKNHNTIVRYGQECPLCKKKEFTKVKPSKQYQKYSQDIEPYMHEFKSKTGQVTTPINLKCIFYCKTRARGDLVGYLQSIQDILVDYGILLDDNRDIVAATDGSRVLYDKNNPRTEITISKITNYIQWKGDILNGK